MTCLWSQEIMVEVKHLILILGALRCQPLCCSAHHSSSRSHSLEMLQERGFDMAQISLGILSAYTHHLKWGQFLLG